MHAPNYKHFPAPGVVVFVWCGAAVTFIQRSISITFTVDNISYACVDCVCLIKAFNSMIVSVMVVKSNQNKQNITEPLRRLQYWNSFEVPNLLIVIGLLFPLCSCWIRNTEQSGLMVSTHYLVFGSSRFQISARRPATLTVGFRGFRQSLQENCRIVPQIGPRQLSSTLFTFQYSLIVNLSTLRSLSYWERRKINHRNK